MTTNEKLKKIKSTLYFWLYDKKSSVLIEKLEISQLKGLLLSFSLINLDQWLIWYPPLSQWKELISEYPKIIGDPNKITPPPLPEEASQQILAKINPLTKDISCSEIDKRLSKRFEKEITVLISHEGRIFINTTQNISLSGLKLKKSLTFKTNQTLTILLKITPHPIEVFGYIVSSGDDIRNLKILPNKNIDQLRMFLLRPEL